MTDIYAIFDQSYLGAELELEQSGTTLLVNAVANVNRTAFALQPKATGRWYAELMVYGSGSVLASVGVATLAASLASYVGGDANGWGYRLDLGQIHNNGASAAAVAVAAKGDVIGVLLDMTAAQPTLTWYRNGTLVYTANLTSTGPWLLAASLGDAGTGSPLAPTGMRCFLNAGQRTFDYAPNEQGWYEPAPAIRGVHVASEDWLSAPTDAIPNARYAGLIDGGNNELRAVRSLDFWPWKRGVRTGAMVLTALNSAGQFDDLLTGDARDQAVTVSRVASGQTYADRVGLFSAVVDSVGAVDDLTVKLTCRDPLGLLDVPLQRRLQRPDADPAAANQPLPIVLGACRNVPTVLTSAPGLVYAVTDAPMLGIGYVRDSGYPLSPAAAPPDFTLDAVKTSLVLDHSPTGKITADISSVGGDQLPAPSSDILGGAGAPFTGSDGAAPAGWTTGNDTGGTPPVMDSGKLVFPRIEKSATIRIEGRVRTDALTVQIPGDGSAYGALVRITWYDIAGNELRKDISTTLTGTNAYTTLTATGTAPAGAVRADAEFAAYAHTGGYMRTGKMRAWYVITGGDVEIALTNADFAAGDTGWFKEAGWSIHPAGALGDAGAAYAEKAPGVAVPPSDELYAAMRNQTLIDFGGAGAITSWATVTAVKIGAGKSYKLTITISAMPADGNSTIALATGTTADKIIASWKVPGTYTLTITNSDGVDHDLYLLSVPAASNVTPTPPTVDSIALLTYDDTYNPDPISLVPATLQAIPLADYLHQVLDVRGSRIGVAWSLADAQAIDTATGYAGLGVYLAGGETVAQALDVALASYTACKWVDGAGTLRIARLRDPAAGAPVGTLDINAMGGDLVPVMDAAPGLTTQMGVRRNWAQLSDGDLVSASTNFPLAVRQSMLRQYQQIVSSAQPLAGAYRHALYAAPVVSCFDQAADAQAEIDRVAALYTVPRWFYAVALELADYPTLDLDQVWTLVYPRYGLAAGKPVLVVDFQPDLLAGTANIILWG